MSSQTRRAFIALILSQAAHSIEEYVFRLYDVFTPARVVSGLLSDDLAFGFALANVAIVAFGLWCYVARVRTDRPSGPAWAWLWAVVELGNGIGHATFALVRGGYFPGVATAPVLAGVSVYLAVKLSQTRRAS